MDRIPSYAVINEAAEAAAKRDRGFVNAVLRNVAKRGKIVPEGEWPRREAILYSHPEFLLRMWEKQYGKDIAEQIAVYDQTRPKVYGRINTLKSDIDIRSLPEVTMLEGDCFTYDGNLVNTPWLKDGTILQMKQKMRAMTPDKKRVLICYGGMRVVGTSLQIQTRISCWETFWNYETEEQAIAALQKMNAAIDRGLSMIEM
jgi:hypothetical protein